MKILITGGHPAPALAVIEHILKEHIDTALVFVGRRYNNDREQTKSLEYQEVTRLKIPFYPLATGRITRSLSRHTIPDLLRIPKGMIRAWQIITHEKPDRVLVFGGYIALPIAVAAWLNGIPVVLHEQTIHPGTAAQVISRFAHTVCVSFPQTKSHFSRACTVLTGNPVRPSVLYNPEPVSDLPADRPLLYITGGSLGSHSLNIQIEQILSALTSRFTVVHQTGNVAEYQDYDRLINARNQLSDEGAAHYLVFQHLSGSHIGYLLSNAHAVVSRSGANTIAELIAFRVPAVLVPLPWSAHQEQQKQAQVLADAGVALIHNQTDSAQALHDRIITITKNPDQYRSGYSVLSQLHSADAPARILETVFHD